MTHATLVLSHQRIARPTHRAAKPFSFGWIITFLLVSLVGTAAAYVVVTNRIITANYAIRRGEARIYEFREDLKVLEAEVAKAKSITELQAAAARQGLVPADHVSYVQAGPLDPRMGLIGAGRDVLTQR